MKRLLPIVKPRSPDDTQVTQASASLRSAGPECLARAGDCEAAWRLFHDVWLAEKSFDEPTLRTTFGTVVRRCGDRCARKPGVRQNASHAGTPHVTDAP